MKSNYTSFTNPSDRYYRMINTSCSLQHLLCLSSLICSYIGVYFRHTLYRCEVYVIKRNYTSLTTSSLMNNHSGNRLYRSDSMIFRRHSHHSISAQHITTTFMLILQSHINHLGLLSYSILFCFYQS